MSDYECFDNDLPIPDDILCFLDYEESIDDIVWESDGMNGDMDASLSIRMSDMEKLRKLIDGFYFGIGKFDSDKNYITLCPSDKQVEISCSESLITIKMLIAFSSIGMSASDKITIRADHLCHYIRHCKEQLFKVGKKGNRFYLSMFGGNVAMPILPMENLPNESKKDNLVYTDFLGSHANLSDVNCFLPLMALYDKEKSCTTNRLFITDDYLFYYHEPKSFVFYMKKSNLPHISINYKFANTLRNLKRLGEKWMGDYVLSLSDTRIKIARKDGFEISSSLYMPLDSEIELVGKSWLNCLDKEKFVSVDFIRFCQIVDFVVSSPTSDKKIAFNYFSDMLIECVMVCKGGYENSSMLLKIKKGKSVAKLKEMLVVNAITLKNFISLYRSESTINILLDSDFLALSDDCLIEFINSCESDDNKVHGNLNKFYSKEYLDDYYGVEKKDDEETLYVKKMEKTFETNRRMERIRESISM